MTETKTQNVFYRAENYRPEDSVGYLMKQIINMVSQDVERQLAHTDLTSAQWVPLFKIHFGQASTVAELARECSLDAGAMTRLLDRLEAKGLCKRVRSETDRRVVNLELTPAGTQAASEIPETLSGVQNAHLAGFSEEEFQTLRDYLRRILHNAHSIADLAHDTTSPKAEPDAAS
ncbi:MarR family transcriptional regulator [Rhodoferax lacus]|uniref:MarR family transcriptional regulator n=1 Tax=Rhodoferax lacus TaxID=2184758 RepID=A0A3E1RI60_9BURK|nr:MarR family transcriptional regulator [Rhodoferax lacus]RFO98921.1 MarR family transcriptional regulator [Rhodoferax lacus]